MQKLDVSHVDLEAGKHYRFEVSGIFSNRNGREYAHAEYVMEDGWATKYDGLLAGRLSGFDLY